VTAEFLFGGHNSQNKKKRNKILYSYGRSFVGF